MGTTDDGDTPTDGSGDGGVDCAGDETDAVLPPPMGLDGSSKMFGQCRINTERERSDMLYGDYGGMSCLGIVGCLLGTVVAAPPRRVTEREKWRLE